MKFLSAKAQITLGLVSVLVSVLCGAMLFGFVPEHKSSVMDGRGDLCESIAVVSSHLIGKGETEELSQLLTEIVKRTPNLLSSAIRNADGSLVTEIGDHEAFWLNEGMRSTENEVLVPVHTMDTADLQSSSANGTGQVRRWGSVEMRFVPVTESGFASVYTHPWVLMTIFVAATSGVLFYLYLRKMLKNLDPSKAVPKRVRAALDSLAEGLLVLDCKGRIVLANQAFSEWVDVPAEKLTGAEAASFTWETQSQNENGGLPWVDAIAFETAQAGVMIGLKQPDKPVQNLIANASPVLGYDGKYGGVLVSFDDVTQLEDTRKDLKIAKDVAEYAQQQAETANKAKTEFLARMSHEIRTPMNAILGYTDVLRNGFDENVDDRSAYLNTIHGSGEHLLAIINDILDLSKIESDQMELDNNRHSVYELISQVVAVMKVKAKEKSIGLSFEADGLVPETILTDAVRFRQAIFNLVGNAVKFTEQGNVRIVVGLNEDDLLKVDVIDTGVGIARDAVEKVFERFTQADASVSTKFGGTGLGLSISKKLAGMMGGDISVSSILGEGSTFTLTMNPGPITGITLVDPTVVCANTLNSKNAPTAVKLPPCRILIVDDESANRSLAGIYITQAGGTFAEACDGQEAIEKTLVEDFDVILMDFNMPVMGGLEATRRLRTLDIKTPVIALTANVMQDDKDRALAAGCDGFLTKPIGMNNLLNEVKRLLPEHCTNAVTQTLPSSGQVKSQTVHESRVQGVEDEVPSKEPFSDNADSDSKSMPPMVSTLPTEIPAFQAIVAEFVPRLRTRVAELRAFVDNGEFEQAREPAHWLKGSAGTVGFAAFTDPARELEAAFHAQDSHTAARIMQHIETLVDTIQVTASATTTELVKF